MIQPNRRLPANATPFESTRGFGLLTPTRQRQWLRGIRHRFHRGMADRQTMIERQGEEVTDLQQHLTTAYEQTLQDCRGERKSMLTIWDQSDERTIANYESQTLLTRDQMNHALVALRKKRKQDIAAEEQWYDTEVERVQANYNDEKPKPGLQQKQDFALIEKRLVRLQSGLDGAREIALHRLGGPAALATPEPKEESAPAAATVKECLIELDRLGDRVEQITGSLRSGLPAKFVESYYLVIVMLAAALLWAGGVYLLGPQKLVLAMLAGLPVAVVVGVVTHTVMGIPLRKQTRQLYPQAEQSHRDGLALVQLAKQIATNKAKQWAAELIRVRDQSLEQLRVVHTDKMSHIKETFNRDNEQTTHEFQSRLAKIERDFQESYSSQSRSMFVKAEETAARLSQKLAEADRKQRDQLQQQQDAHADQVRRLRMRVEQGLQQGLDRVQNNLSQFESRFPAWDQVLSQPESDAEMLRWLPLGHLNIADQIRDSLADAAVAPQTMPLVLPRESQAAVVIDCPPDQMHIAAEWVRAVLWRGLSAIRPGRMRLTLLDPIGRGQNFASLVTLGDFDPLLIGHRAWVSAPQIYERLTELTQHIEDVLQACLRDRYSTIEDFNLDAGPLAEPYRVLVAFGLPTGLTRDSADALRAIIEGGRRCGVFSILIRDTSQAWSSDLPALPDSQVLRLKVDASGNLWHAAPGLESIAVVPLEPPPQASISLLAERIGRGALAAHRVEIPLDDCLPPSEYDTGSAAKGLSIPVGRQGVGRLLEIQLGTGMRQHMLVAGKTGSGKSTLLHSMIMAAALKYSPDELHLYLLDFKKGVEFKVYAECGLPHARVIGIESEREFGRSVLERLDEELQRRGELFRAAGVQDLADYRRSAHNNRDADSQSPDILPRILLVVDEFQELFVRDDRVAQECTMLLDRLVRQGRSFGMHVVLSSQSLSGAYTLPRATLGQMAIRIALQCSESDAALILADDNTAARLLSRPGEAIFNDAGGLIEGNQPFQVAWMDSQLQRERLAGIAERHQNAQVRHGMTVVFEGNRPARWSIPLVETALTTSASSRSDASLRGLLGEAVRIGPPATLGLTQSNGRNILCVADLDTTTSVLATWLPSAAADAIGRTGRPLEIFLLDGSRAGEGSIALSGWLTAAGVVHHNVKLRDAEGVLKDLAARVAAQAASGLEESETSEVAADAGLQTIVAILGLERFRELRQDDSFGFSLDGSAANNGSASLQALLRDGPQVGCHVFLGCGGAETLSRWLPRTAQHDLELRLIGRVSANDSAQLIDTPEATDLSNAAMFFYDDADGHLEKFRICEVPEAELVRTWLQPRLPNAN